MNEVHAGVCGGHQSGPKLQYSLKGLATIGQQWWSIVLNTPKDVVFANNTVIMAMCLLSYCILLLVHSHLPNREWI